MVILDLVDILLILAMCYDVYGELAFFSSFDPKKISDVHCFREYSNARLNMTLLDS